MSVYVFFAFFWRLINIWRLLCAIAVHKTTFILCHLGAQWRVSELRHFIFERQLGGLFRADGCTAKFPLISLRQLVFWNVWNGGILPSSLFSLAEEKITSLREASKLRALTAFFASCKESWRKFPLRILSAQRSLNGESMLWFHFFLSPCAPNLQLTLSSGPPPVSHVFSVTPPCNHECPYCCFLYHSFISSRTSSSPPGTFPGTTGPSWRWPRSRSRGSASPSIGRRRRDRPVQGGCDEPGGGWRAPKRPAGGSLHGSLGGNIFIALKVYFEQQYLKNYFLDKGGKAEIKQFHSESDSCSVCIPNTKLITQRKSIYWDRHKCDQNRQKRPFVGKHKFWD